MKTNSTLRVSLPGPVEAATLVKEAWQGVGASFEQFCLASGLASLQQMMEEDASLLAGSVMIDLPTSLVIAGGGPGGGLAFTAAR